MKFEDSHGMGRPQHWGSEALEQRQEELRQEQVTAVEQLQQSLEEQGLGSKGGTGWYYYSQSFAIGKLLKMT